MSARLLLERLDSKLALLTTGPCDAPARQQTLRATIAWSYDLLQPEAQQLLDRLSVFGGSFGVDAAERVGQAKLDELALLVEHNMVIRVPSSSGALRYGLLETVREFAAEKLEARGESSSTRRRACEWVASLGVEARAGLRGPEQRAWRERLEPELGNVREAVAHSLNESAEVAQRLCADLDEIWVALHLHREGLDAAVAALELGSSRPETRCGALAVVARTALYGGDLAKARQVSEQILAIGRSSEARWLAELTVAHVAAADGDLGAARPAAEAGLALAQESGDEWFVAWALNALATVQFHEGETSEVVGTMLESRRRMAKTGDQRSVFMLDSNIAEFLLGIGRLDEARAVLARLADEGPVIGDVHAELSATSIAASPSCWAGITKRHERSCSSASGVP